MTQRLDFAIDYIELYSANLPRTRRFYEAAFGWKFEDYGPGYSSFSDGRIAGGFTGERSRPERSALVILFAADLAAAQARVEAAGGSIARPIFAFPGGLRFHFLDPDGNELAVWSDQDAGE